MTFSGHPVLYCLWVVVMIAQLCVLALLDRRKAFREYPAFTGFIGFCVMRSAVLFYLAGNAPQWYLPVRWLAYVPQLVIVVMLVLEVFHILFHPYETLPADTIGHFVEACIAVVMVAVAFAVCFPGAQPTAWMTFARAMDQVVTWVLCLIFGLIVLFAKYFGIPWRHRVFGIGAGFVFYLSVDVGVTTVVAQYHLPRNSPVWGLDMLAFLIACFTWSYYFATEEAPRTVPTLEELRRIQAALHRIAGAIHGISETDPVAPASETARPRGRFPALQLHWRRMR